VGGILVLIGAILFGIMLIRMDEVESGFKIAGILLIAGIILNFISGGIGLIIMIVSMVLVYTSSKSALKPYKTD
jgi:hypothetical protein